MGSGATSQVYKFVDADWLGHVRLDVSNDSGECLHRDALIASNVEILADTHEAAWLGAVVDRDL